MTRVARLTVENTAHHGSEKEFAPPDGTLLITGGTGALGAALGLWLLERRTACGGAGALVLGDAQTPVDFHRRRPKNRRLTP